MCCLAQGDLAGARSFYQEDLSIAVHLSKTDPANTTWQHDLAVAYGKMGKVMLAQGKNAASHCLVQ